MLTLIIVALVGSSMLNSNTTTVCDWVKSNQDFLSEGIVEPVLPQPNGRYIVNGPKEIRWVAPLATSDGRPEGIVFVPTGMENQKKTEVVKPKPKPTNKSVVQSIFAMPPVPHVEKVTTAGSPVTEKQVGIENLGILGDKKQLSGVNNDEILSFFQKTSTITPTGNEETGAIIIPAEQKPAETTSQSSATFESK